MLTQICAKIRNYFTQDADKLIGDYSVVEGCLVPSVPLQEGQYYRIVGSVFNDGVHAYNDFLVDETKFHGAVWLMRIPKELIEISEEMQAWMDLYGGVDSVVMSPYQSESFGGYTYSKASAGRGDGGNGGSQMTVWDAFESKLSIYRKLIV